MSFRDETILETASGAIRLRSFCSPGEIRQYAFDTEFGRHAQYRSLYTKKESLEKDAKRKGVNVVLAVDTQETIVGFGVLDFPETDERWLDMGPGLMMELKVIEVCRSWRSSGLATDIVKLLVDGDEVNDMILYLVGYSWTWDLDGTEKTAQAYRKMLINLFEPHGFEELQTNEPNICLKPENIFMARIGDHISDDVRTQFKWLRFGVTP
ncbi:MAG: N-acetyltransferase [Deltaproteobacteria bacterium]|nr:MAG: N-acetyltransferase [Deltaproteobacteria bacterium]